MLSPRNRLNQHRKVSNRDKLSQILAITLPILLDSGFAAPIRTFNSRLLGQARQQETAAEKFFARPIDSLVGERFRKLGANEVGETTQFGPSPSADRRVVVAVSP